jgi:hypothetical protein
VNTDLETSFVLSKYKPKTVLKRDINMSMIVIEFVNVLVINIKLNENNKMEQIKYIKKMLDKYNKKNVILVGDLNFDYNIEDDLVKKELVQIGFVDTCYIDKYTYDTTVNKMCWNLTYTRNRIRNNVILYKTSKFKPDKIHLFGTQHVFSIDKNDVEVNKFITAGKKMDNSLYKSRTDVNAWKMDNSLNDPVYGLGKRLAQVETNSAIKKYTDFLASKPNLVSDVERPGFVKLSDSPAYGSLKGKYVLNSAAEDLK